MKPSASSPLLLVGQQSGLESKLTQANSVKCLDLWLSHKSPLFGEPPVLCFVVTLELLRLVEVVF